MERTIDNIIIDMDHNVIVPALYDPIDDIIEAMWDIREHDLLTRNEAPLL